MLVKRKTFIIASAALMAVAVPGVLLADNNPTQSMQQNGQNNQGSQSDRDQQNEKVSGTVQSYHDVNVDGATHFRVRVKESNGQTKSVDLGECARCSDLVDNLEQGDQITAYGQSQKIDGKPVVVADRASVDGKSYPIDQAGDASAQKNDQSRNDNDKNPNQGEKSLNGEATASNQGDQKNDKSQRPSTVLLLDERMVFVGEGDLDRHLIMAKQDLRMGDARAASGELRVAADRIELYADGSHGHSDATKLLDQSRQDLTHLADQIGKNTEGVKPREIDDAAAQAQAALAKYYDEQIQNDGAKDRPIETGYNLQAAAVHAREAMVWSNANVSDHAARTVQTAFKAADELLSGDQKAGSDAEKVAENLDHQIDQFDKEHEQSQANSGSSEMKSDKDQGKDQKQSDHEKQQPNRGESQAEAN
jgi:hypothetical protein